MLENTKPFKRLENNPEAVTAEFIALVISAENQLLFSCVLHNTSDIILRKSFVGLSSCVTCAP